MSTTTTPTRVLLARLNSTTEYAAKLRKLASVAAEMNLPQQVESLTETADEMEADADSIRGHLLAQGYDPDKAGAA